MATGRRPVKVTYVNMQSMIHVKQKNGRTPQKKKNRTILLKSEHLFAEFFFHSNAYQVLSKSQSWKLSVYPFSHGLPHLRHSETLT